jgi:hypothetical protein
MRARIITLFSLIAIITLVSGCRLRKKNRCATCPTWTNVVTENSNGKVNG